jgi:hypothetical protein
MKKALVFAFLSIAASSVYAAPANLFSCTGNNATANFTASGFVGDVLTITMGGKTFTGRNSEIGTEQTVLGDLLTLTTERIPDLHTDTLTLLLPDVNILNFGGTKSFTTRLMSTRTLSSLAGPQLVDGVIQNNRFISMKCTAELVAF